MKNDAVLHDLSCEKSGTSWDLVSSSSATGSSERYRTEAFFDSATKFDLLYPLWTLSLQMHKVLWI